MTSWFPSCGVTICPLKGHVFIHHPQKVTSRIMIIDARNKQSNSRWKHHQRLQFVTYRIEIFFWILLAIYTFSNIIPQPFKKNHLFFKTFTKKQLRSFNQPSSQGVLGFVWATTGASSLQENADCRICFSKSWRCWLRVDSWGGGLRVIKRPLMWSWNYFWRGSSSPTLPESWKTGTLENEVSLQTGHFPLPWLSENE